MKHPRIIIGALGLALAGAAGAQSNVTLYGSLDLAPVYVSNVHGHTAKLLSGGTTQPDRLGFRGQEDLGDGLYAIYGLESGIAPDVGTTINPTKFFNREAKVGLSSRTLGTLVMGHLTDTMFDYVGRDSNGYNLFNFNLFHPGNFDGLANMAAFDNAIKYVTPTLAGFQGTLEAGAAEGAGRNLGAGFGYTDGGFRAAAAYTRSDRKSVDIAGKLGLGQALGQTLVAGKPLVLDRLETYGAGAVYAIGAFNLNAAYTQNTFTLGAADAHMRNVDLGVVYRTTDLNWLNIGVSDSRFEGARWSTFGVMDLYWLSKRTQVYAQATVQRAGGDASFASINAIGVSGSAHQAVLSAGVHHSF